MLSKFSFGTYRTTSHNPYHAEALNYALDSGITHIDTSSNYMNGEAEELIGVALKKRNREEITIVSKGGYIQGTNMQRVQEGWEVEDLVEYDASCYHSISPQFLFDQINNSLHRMQLSYIDVYLLHNPEYYLMSELKGSATDEDIEKHHSIMQERIKKAFEFLEEMVQSGRIRGYGISSNSFAKEQNDYHFLEYRDLVEYAKEIAGENHHFKVMQLPMNMLETGGEAAAIWAHENGLEVHVNRPLNAATMGSMIRLASYEKCEEYDELLSKVKEIPNKHLQGIVSRLEEIKEKFKWAGEVDDSLEYQVIPYIVNNIKLPSEYFELIDQYLECYKSHVKHNLSLIVASRLNIQEPIDKKAIEFLQNRNYITRILVGMRSTRYVDRVLSYAK